MDHSTLEPLKLKAPVPTKEKGREVNQGLLSYIGSTKAK